MLMADYGLGLWGGCADFEPIENDNMSIDLDSFMDLLQEEPTHAQINSEHLPPSDSWRKDLFSSAGTQEPNLGKSETGNGNGSAVDTTMEFFGATENSSCKQTSMILGTPVKDEACIESSTSHYPSATFEDHISHLTDHRLPVHYNSDCHQAFLFHKEMSAGIKDEARVHYPEKTYITGNSGYERSGPKISSGILTADVSDVVGPDSKYEFGDAFLVLDGGCSTGLNNETKEQPFSWGSLYESTFSSNNQVVKDERRDLTVPSSNIYLNSGATVMNNFSFSETRHVGVKNEDREIDLAKNSKEACYPGNVIKEDGSSSKLLQAIGTHILRRVPASLHQHHAKEKDRRVGMAAPNNSSQNSCIDEEHLGTNTKSSGMFVLPNVTNTTPSNCSPESTQSNSVDCRSQVDDESDICIIEEMSHPAPTIRSVIPGKSMKVPKPSNFYESCHYSGLGGSRIKAHSERSVLLVAAQDLSQPKLELNPPDGSLSVPLLRHQRIALAWMVKKETAITCSGGILADDQGLGKTVSTISLILKERPPSSKPCQQNLKFGEFQTLDLVDEDNDDGKGIKSKVVKVDSGSVQVPSSAGNSCSFSQKIGRPAGGTLVVCPTSVLRQWAEELHNKVTAQTNLSVLIYHGGNRTKDPFELSKHDVVLTTYSIVSMEVPKQSICDKDDVENGKWESQEFPGADIQSSKKRKNPSGSNKRKSKDGNGLLEATAGPLAKVRWFRVVLDEAQSIKNHKTQVAKACWGLRAKRRWCLSGTPIQNAIDDLYSYFKFLRYDPYDSFTTFCTNIKTPIQRNPVKGYKKLQAILKTIMLRRTKGMLLDGEPIIDLPPKSVILQKVEFSDEERSFYAKLEADSRAQFKEYAAAGTVRENYVNILLMLLRLRQACDHPLLVKGYNSSTEWKSSVEMAKRLPVEKQRYLLNCLEASLAICTICNDPPEEAVVSLCGHVFCNQCLREHTTGDECECPVTNCKAKLSNSSTFSKAALNISLDGDDSSMILCTEKEKDEHRSAISSPFGSSKIRSAIKVLQSLSKNFGSPNSSHGLEKKCLKDSNNKPPPASSSVSREKAILFSQWTKMLDLIEACLKSSSIQYRRLDGTMTVTARDKAVKDFNTLPEVTVMIMSLKAASLGLNMVSANHVFLMDLWWNPTTEDQAIDRAHRIGQTRPVTVLRLTVKDTVEDRILALQDKKREMVASAFGEDESGSRQTRLTVEDLNYLFMV